MSLYDDLVELGKRNKGLRRHIRPVLSTLREKASGVMGRLRAADPYLDNKTIVDILLLRLRRGNVQEAQKVLTDGARSYQKLAEWLGSASDEDLEDFIEALEEKK